MRYYAISITDASGKPIPVGPFATAPQFTSFVNGQTLQGALNVDMDLPVFNWDTPMGGSLLRIWGVDLKNISQASNLNGANIQISGGMQKGLPLANPKQSGLLLDGVIQQAFGNWQGTQQSLDLIITAGFGTQKTPKNIVLNWQTGTPMAQAVALALDTAFPDYKINISISDKLILTTETQPAVFENIGQFASYLNSISAAIIGGTYQGVKLTSRNKEFFLYDGTSLTTPIDIQFTDLIGQPTWIDFGTVQFKTAMRADLQVGDFIRMPPGQQTILAASFSQYRDKSVFQGVFQVSQLRHIGNFRQRDANSWVTVINAVVRTS